jgi:uncharacterized protein (TIGR03000 family)
MFRRWLPALAVGAALLLAAAPARAQFFRGRLMPVPTLGFGSPFGLPFVTPGYYAPGLPGYGSYYPDSSWPYQGVFPRYSTPVLPSDYRRTQRANPNGLEGRPKQKIEEFEATPAKDTRPPADVPTKAEPARLEVHVPAGAEVWFDGQKSSETGTVRTFETPVLQPREFSSYEVRVRRKGAATDTDEIRHVILRAGEKRTVEIMTRPEGGTRLEEITPPAPKPDKR